MINFLKKIFNKESKTESIAKQVFNEPKQIIIECSLCNIEDLCIEKEINKELCEYRIDLSTYDINKPSILILDDNPGVLSFLKEDIEELNYKNKIDLTKYNLLLISTDYAAFTIKLLLNKIKNINITHAIIDITLGGSRPTKTGTVKYTGVDVFEMLYAKNKELKYIFYTGNNLNPNINSNKKLINQFNKITNENILDKVLYKTAMGLSNRQKFFEEKLFN